MSCFSEEGFEAIFDAIFFKLSSVSEKFLEAKKFFCLNFNL